MPAPLEEKLSDLWASVRSDSPQRHVRAAEIASDIYALCIEQITETELFYCSSLLLNEKNGVVKFLQESATLDEFANCKEELLHLLNDYVKSVGHKILSYAVGIKDVCVSLFSRDKTAKVKNATFPLLITVLELCGKSDIADSLNVPKLAEKFFQAALQPTKHTSTVRCGVYHLLGVLCQQFPECMIDYSSRLISIYTGTLKAEMVSKKGKKPELPVITGCLRGLTAYLYSFTQSAAEGSVYAQDIYNFTRRAIDPEASLTRYDVPKAGLALLAEHAEQFKEYLAKDTEQMYSSLYSWCSHNNRECKLAGLKAMESFFKQVSNQIAESGDRKTSIKVYRDFMKRFRLIIDNPNTHHKELAVAIKGYGFFAKPCKAYGTPEDLQYMFSEMVQRSEQLFFTNLEATTTIIEEVLFHLPTFMQALASITNEIEELPEGFRLSLEHLVVFMFESYPRLPKHVIFQSGVALLKLLMAVSTKPMTYQQFLSHIVFQGLVRSCSHPVVMEAGDGSAVVSLHQGVVEEETSAENRVASYKDYIEIWTQLMDPKKLKGIGGDYTTHELRQNVHLSIYSEFVHATLTVIKKLDLSVSFSTQVVTDESSSSEGVGEGLSSDPVAGLLPTVPRDFQIFINLVELCRRTLPSITPHLFSQWVFIFSKDVVATATQYPLVSGFYKLLACVLNICKKIDYFKGMSSTHKNSTHIKTEVDMETVAMETDSDEDKNLCFLLFRKFIREVVVRMQQYKDDLLSSCLQLVLSIPTEMVQSDLDSLIPAVELSLKLGVGYLPLAKIAVDTLETWMQQIPSDKLHYVVARILPLLDDYLQTSAKTGQNSSDVVTVSLTSSRSSRGRKLPMKVMKQWKEGMEVSANDLNKIRERILYLLGSLGGVVNTVLLERESSGAVLSQAVSWDTRKKLEFPIPFSDMKPTIYIDPFLPRVCELAVSSSDRQTKVAACEFLHAAVLFILGKSIQQVLQKKSPMTKLFKRVFPFLLQLGCDVERVAEQLFRPLIFQMIHWFTRNTQYESPDTMVLLDAILEGMEHPTDTSLRDFCAQCVKEFLLWSIKQTSKKQQERSPINTKSLLKRIYSMASHPSATKRLGAALALNSIYTVFREEETLVDMFVLEMMVVMINSLKTAHRDNTSLGTVDQCKQSISHIAKIVRAKSTLLCSSSKNRRVPRGLKGADLSQLVVWLLSQSGCPEAEARQQCIQLFATFAPLASKVPNTRVWIRRTIESEGGLFFVSRFERGSSSHGGGIARTPTLTKTSSLPEALKWLDNLQAALDCYIWVLKDQLVSPSEVFSQLSPADKTSQLFTSLEYFLADVVTLKTFEATKEAASFLDEPSEMSPLEEEQYSVSRSRIISRILTFSDILLVKHTSESVTSITSPSLWAQPLWSVLLSVVFDQLSVGLQQGDFASRNNMVDKAVKVLRAIAKHFPEDLEGNIVTFFSKKLSEKPYNLIDRLPINISEKWFIQEHLLVDRLIQGYLCLAEGNLLKPVLKLQGVDVSQTLNLILMSVLEGVVAGASGSEGEQIIGDPAQMHTMELLLKLALYCIDDDVSFLLQVILCQTKGSENGLLLYLKFSDVLNSELVKQSGPVVTTLLTYSPSIPHAVCTVLNGIVDYILKDKSLRKQKLPEFCSILMCNWHQLSSWWADENKSSETKLAAIGLLQKVLSAQPKLFESFENKENILDVVDMYCQLVSDPKSSLNFKSKVLEVLTPFLNISDDIDTKLRTSLKTLVSNQFPLNSSELPEGSAMYNEYISVLDRLLGSLVSSGSLLLLELIISIACREKRHVHEENILSSLAKFVKGLSDRAVSEALNLSYGMFTNERDYPTEARRGIGERVCCNLLSECSRSALLEFFVNHIVEITGSIGEKTLRTSDPKLEGQLISKICCFQFVEVLYTRLTSSLLSSMDSKINASYCKGPPATGKELTQAVTKSGHAAKSEDLHGDKTLYELRRQYHCHAYNMLVAVIACTQTKPQFYLGFLFKEDLTKGQYLFDNIIDPEKEYKFEIELETPIKRKKQLLTIRDELNQSRKSSPDASSPPGPSPPFPARYISSVYLAESSLSTDVSQYDFTFSSIGHAPTHSSITGSAKVEDGKASSSYLVSEEQLEEDSLNDHECMVPMMKLLDHMQHNKITPEVQKGLVSPEMPPWMCQLHKKLSEGSTERNVRLFIARLVVNRPEVFQPYAKHWLPSLTQLVISGNHGGIGLHYFIVDIIATILSWAQVAVLEDRYLASRLMEYVINHSNHDNRSVFRNNLEITRTLVECWKDYIQVPTKLIYDSFSNPDRSSRSSRTGIQLLGIIVANNLPTFDLATAGSITEQGYYTAFAHNMFNKYKEVYGATAEVLGMLLSYMQDVNHAFKDCLQEIVTNQLLVLSQPAEQNEDRFIMCLHKIQLHHPKIVQRFVDKLLFMLPMLQGVFRSSCLEILQSQADIQPKFYLKLKNVGFHNMLEHRDEATQLASLKIVQGMLNQLESEEISQLLPYVTAFSGHSSVQCRVTMYNVLMTVYNNLCSPGDTDISVTSEIGTNVLTSARDQLLVGLSDSAEEIRLKMYEFWNQDSNLAPSTLGRLSQVLATLYSTKTEQHFLYHATNLLLELTSRSPDFNRSIFDTPLSECKFEDYKSIDLSWHQRHLQMMTPLFAATQASQSGSQPDSATTPGMGTGMLRATQQSLAFTPTQDAGGYTWMVPAAQSMDMSSASFTMGTASQSSDTQTSSSLLFTRSSMRPPLKAPLRVTSERLSKSLSSEESVSSEEESKRREILKLKRRFLKSKETTSAFFARSEARKKIMREEHRKHQRAARQSHVVMYRKYRDGELPDIQIKHSEIIRPLQALAQHDSGLARLLFGSLFNAIFTEVDHHLIEGEADSMKTAIRDGITAVLESSTQYFSPFIGSLQDICYHESQLSVTPSAIATSSLVSKQELIGIMLLEKQLLVNVSQSSMKGAKRSRGTQEVSEATETWVETSRLYKSLSDFDIVHGIFSNLEGIQDITRKALEAEERGDYLEALGLYKEAIGTPGENWATHPTQVEEDLWEDSLLACYSHLTEWRDLETASTLNIDDHTPPRLDAVWEDTYYQEHYLPFILRSKIKLWCMNGKDDRGIERFLEKSFQNESSRLVMESRYPEQVMMAYIMKGDMDRAQYYLSLSLQVFQQEWSTGGDLLSNACGRMQCLQRLTEVKEFLDFMKCSGNHEHCNSHLMCLLDKWRNRYPDPKLDSIPVWDDIITNRCIMLKKMSEKLTIKKGSDAMEVEDGSTVDMTKLFSLEYTHMCMKIADAARVQSNFPVTKKYLHMVEKSIQNNFADDQLLQLQWLHSIANMRLQQMVQDRSPSRCDAIVSLAYKLEEFQSVPILSKNKSITTQHYSIRAKTVSLLADIFSTEEDGPVALSTLSSDVSRELRTLCGFESTESLDPTEVAKKLWCQVISSLNSSIKSGTQRSAFTGKMEPNVTSLEEMATFCDDILRKEDEEDVITGLDTVQFPSVVIVHTLKAMSLGSKKALEQFSRLLQLLEKFPTTIEQFIKKSSSVPCWMFITWISQTVALIDKDEGEAVAEILFKIADTYPQALCYPFKVSTSGFRFANTPKGKKNKSNFERLKEKLRNCLVDDFVAAVDQLNSPELVCKDFLDEIKPLLLQTKRDKTAIEEVWKMLCSQLLEETDSPSLLYGTPSLQRGMKLKAFYKTYHQKIIDKFGKDGSKIHTMAGTQFNKLSTALYESMKPGLSKQHGHGRLKEYSPWLESFQPAEYQQTIEVPGQYDGKSKPMPEYHAKIAGFYSKILVLTSMRKPKRLTIIGDNTKEYMFLVKGGEDLRHDQRIEQLFDIMNGVLCEDAACSQRQLKIRTYQVIPMTTRVGLIEWVKNTKPVKDFLTDELSDSEKKNYHNANNWHSNWVDKYGGYPEVYKKAKPSEVEKEYRRKVAAVPWDLLRRAFLNISSSPEAFLLLRSHFTKTFATANICQYLLGIGDRHLSNFMVDLEYGGIVPIDFGHAFHTATQFLPYPELIPMRLTPQFTNLCLPHKQSGQLRSCMIHTLRALQTSPSTLLNTMDVFIKEPSVDWKNFARKQAAVLKVGAGENDSMWYPREKIRVSKKKLQGYNSSHLMLVDLKYGHQKKPEFKPLENILMGDKRVNLRARVKERCQSVEEQVDCLIDHATDPNILGRTYHGWEPWV